MNKKVLQKVFLVLLPAMAVMLATTGDSVKVYDIPAGTVENYSYFAVIPVAALQICTPMAAVLAVAAVLLALYHVASGKRWAVKGVFYSAFVSTCAAATPTLIRGDVMVVPNVVFTILMAVLCFLSNVVRRQKEEKPTGKRLGRKK